MHRVSDGLFSLSIYEVFDDVNRRIRTEVEAIPCDKIAEPGLAEKLAKRYAIAVPEFDETPSGARLDDKGEFATYRHKIKNSESFRVQPTNSPIIGRHYDVALTQTELALKFRANPQQGANKQMHKQIADTIAGNVRNLATEIPPRNKALQRFAEQVISERARFCNNLERQRADLL